jgi:4-hydroxybenzoate polyprenyltransferase
MNLLKRFNIYQKERFPLGVLVCTTSVVVLSSAAVTHGALTWISFCAAFIGGIFYLFHIRVVDEIRDASHDSTYHASRPIPRGLISLKELQMLDAIGITVLIGIALIAGVLPTLCIVCALGYTFIAGKEFFLGEWVRSHFLIYNGINLVQMILLQFFVYSLFSNSWYKSNLVWIHLIFIFLNAVLLEVLRKIKITPEESQGHDTYSWHMGFKQSLFIFLIFIIASYAAFLYIIFEGTFFTYSVSISLLFMIFSIATIVIHTYTKNKRSENLLYLSTFGMYIGLHLIIYFTL